MSWLLAIIRSESASLGHEVFVSAFGEVLSDFQPSWRFCAAHPWTEQMDSH